VRKLKGSAWNVFVPIGEYSDVCKCDLLSIIPALVRAFAIEEWVWNRTGKSNPGAVPNSREILKAFRELEDNVKDSGCSRTGGLMTERLDSGKFRVYALAQLAQHIQPQRRVL